MMDKLNWMEIVSILIALFALALSIRNLILRRKLNQTLESKVANSNIESNIEKLIRMRNANSVVKNRSLTDKEISNLINKLEILTQDLKDQEKKYFESTWKLKNQRDKLNYLMKLINESKDTNDFKRFDRI
jgi:hypothetical protein